MGHCLEQSWDAGPWRKLNKGWTNLTMGCLPSGGILLPPQAPPPPADSLAPGLPAHSVLPGAGSPSLAFPAKIFHYLFSPLSRIWLYCAFLKGTQ